MLAQSNVLLHVLMYILGKAGGSREYVESLFLSSKHQCTLHALCLTTLVTAVEKGGEAGPSSRAAASGQPPAPTLRESFAQPHQQPQAQVLLSLASC